jgi:dTDP-4-amino-4,6-dideoxygalactose transaminase
MSATISRDNAEADFQSQIRDYFRAKHVFLVSSGKAALYLTLDALRQMSRRRVVIIPAYSSFCLASAVARTGLPIKLCDVDPDTLDFDLVKLKSLIDERTLAVIPVHNYGLVCNLREIKRLAAAKGTFVIEDAAQAAGASFENCMIGTIGNIGILSLGRGKNVCTLGGGVILTNDDRTAALILKELERCPRPSLHSDMASLLVGTGLALFLDPKRYVIPSHLPFLRIGANIFDPNFTIERFPTLKAGIGRKVFCRLDHYNQIRIRNAHAIKNGLKPLLDLRVPRPEPKARSVYLRFPILFAEEETREQVFQLLHQQGLGVSCSYPTPLNKVSSFKKYLVGEDDFPGARFVAKRILTLPTHSYVEKSDIGSIVSTIHGVTTQRNPKT